MNLPDPLKTTVLVDDTPFVVTTHRLSEETDAHYLGRHRDALIAAVVSLESVYSMTEEEMGLETVNTEEESNTELSIRHVREIAEAAQ